MHVSEAHSTRSHCTAMQLLQRHTSTACPRTYTGNPTPEAALPQQPRCSAPAVSATASVVARCLEPGTRGQQRCTIAQPQTLGDQAGVVAMGSCSWPVAQPGGEPPADKAPPGVTSAHTASPGQGRPPRGYGACGLSDGPSCAGRVPAAVTLQFLSRQERRSTLATRHSDPA